MGTLTDAQQQQLDDLNAAHDRLNDRVKAVLVQRGYDVETPKNLRERKAIVDHACSEWDKNPLEDGSVIDTEVLGIYANKEVPGMLADLISAQLINGMDDSPRDIAEFFLKIGSIAFMQGLSVGAEYGVTHASDAGGTT